MTCAALKGRSSTATQTFLRFSAPSQAKSETQLTLLWEGTASAVPNSHRKEWASAADLTHAPFLLEPSRRLCGDGAAVPKACDVEVERRNLGKASQTLRQVLISQAETKGRQVAGSVGDEQEV